MKTAYRLFQWSNGIFFIQHNVTGKQESLKTRDKATARRIFSAKNEACREPAMNLEIVRVYLNHSDPALGATMNTTPTDETILKTGVLVRVKMLLARREQLLDEFEGSGLSGQKFAELVGMKNIRPSSRANRTRKEKRFINWHGI